MTDRQIQCKSYMCVEGGLGGLDPQNPKYPSQTLARLGASAKFWQKNVFLRPFWAIFRPASGIFRKVALPRFLELPTFGASPTNIVVIDVSKSWDAIIDCRDKSDENLDCNFKR